MFRGIETEEAVGCKIKNVRREQVEDETTVAYLLAYSLMRYAKELSSVTTVPEFLRLSAAVYLVVLSVLLVAIGAALKMKRPSTD